MKMDYQGQSAAAGRHILPDLTRACALIGIALVNVAFLAWPSFSGYGEGAFETALDEAADFGVNALFLFKFYTLFAFMFGVGFAYQILSAERRGISFAGQYWRRIVGLLVFGFLHIALLFQGDILVVYAVLGAIFFLFRNKGTRALIGWAIAVYAVQLLLIAALAALTWLGETVAPEEIAAQAAYTQAAVERAHAVFGAGTFGEAVALRISEWVQFIGYGFLMQGLGAFSFFLFGLAAVRAGTIADPGAPIWRRARRVFLPIGLVGSAAGAWIMAQGESVISSDVLLGMTVITLFSPFSSAGYIGLIAAWAQRPAGRLQTFFARGGTATLTAYLMQSLLFSLIFNNYGLGLFGELGAAACTAIAFAVALVSIAFSSLWRLRFKRGPMEAILRGWTYLGTR